MHKVAWDGKQMPKRGSGEKSVPVRINLPEPVYSFLEYAAQHKGLTISEHLRAWILGSLEPWEEPPLPLDAYEVVEIPDETVHAVPVVLKPAEDDRPKRADFATAEEFLKAEWAERQARGAATRKRNREAHPPPMPDHLLRIAEARKLHPTLSILTFSQLLFDQDIYRVNKYGPRDPTPVDPSTLAMWLRKLRQAGLLSEH